MIDVENEIYTKLKNAITSNSSLGDVYVSSVYELVPKKLPACMIEQTDSYDVVEHHDSSGVQNINHLVFTISICAGGETKKSDVKKILNVIDNKAYEIGLSRSYSQPITLQDRTDLYEIITRYNCNVSKNKTIYRR